MTLLHAIILGIVEGLTELLPVSSTAHLLVTSSLLGIQQAELVKTFLVAVQFGAVITVCLYYARRIFASRTLWKKILVAFIPTAALGFILYNFVKDILFENLVVIGWALIIGGVVMIVIEEYGRKSNKKIAQEFTEVSYLQSFILGCVQSIALIPGVSRSGATIIGGLMMNIPRKAIVEFSFLLAIPVIGSATVLDLAKADVLHMTQDTLVIFAIGMIVAGLVTWAVIVWFIRFIERHTFIAFGWYRIVLGAIVLLFISN